MKDNDLHQSIFQQLSTELRILDDKPEETVLSTLHTLWLAAAGRPMSAQAAEGKDLPELNNSQIDNLKKLVERRLSGEPLAHITGCQQFMGIELLAGPEALVPRKETELLGSTVINYLNNIPNTRDELAIIDVCTGAGNLAIAYAMNEPRAKVFASDLSSDAVSLAKKNTSHCGIQARVTVTESDLLKAYDTEEFYKQIDVVSCNPPYISSSKVEVMEEEISRHEPCMAFDGGPFGIKILQRLMKEAPKYLRDGGCLMFEVGLGQGDLIIQRIEKTGLYKSISPIKDKKGDVRAIAACI